MALNARPGHDVLLEKISPSAVGSPPKAPSPFDPSSEQLDKGPSISLSLFPLSLTFLSSFLSLSLSFSFFKIKKLSQQ